MKIREVNQTESPIALLAILARRDDDHAARDAFRKFHQQYFKEVRIFSVQFYKEHELIDYGIIDEIAGNVFIKIWQNADKFTVGSGLSEHDQRRLVLAWLRRIVKNEYLLYLRELKNKDLIPFQQIQPLSQIDQSHESESEDEYEYLADDFPEMVVEDAEQENEYKKRHKTELKMIETHLKKLPKLHKKVFMMYINYQDERGRLPKGMLPQFCHRTGMHEDYPRQIKKRILGELKNMFNQVEAE